jgi:hypothetical protein
MKQRSSAHATSLKEFLDHEAKAFRTLADRLVPNRTRCIAAESSASRNCFPICRVAFNMGPRQFPLGSAPSALGMAGNSAIRPHLEP